MYETLKSSNVNLSLNERWGPPAAWQWQTKNKEEDAVVASGVAPHHGCGLVLPKMLLLQVVLLLIMVVGWSYQTSLACTTHHVLSSLPNSEKIKLPATAVLLRLGLSSLLSSGKNQKQNKSILGIKEPLSSGCLKKIRFKESL